ncbi:MAG: Acg family FMN-binding oxidoreductase [Thermaurantiacus sp.]
MLSRRMVLGAAGSGLVLAGCGNLFRAEKLPDPRAPWAATGEPDQDPRLAAFADAILAPNPHNRQPWLIRLDGDDEASIFCDLDRRLPMTDPFDRQIVIGFGCFLEQARIAASARGLALEILPFPEGAPGETDRLDSRPIARLAFRSAPGRAPDPLGAHIRARRTTKEPFDPERPVDAGALAALAADPLLTTSAQPALLQRLSALAVSALRVETQTRRTHMESVELMRIGSREIAANPDGIALAGPVIEGLAAVGLITRDTLAANSNFAVRQGMAATEATYGSFPAALWVVTDGNSRADQLDAGAAYVRANLLATARGLAMHPQSQALQEYPEMAAHLADVHGLLGVAAPARIQMLARLGHGPDVPPAPRWPLETRITA